MTNIIGIDYQTCIIHSFIEEFLLVQLGRLGWRVCHPFLESESVLVALLDPTPGGRSMLMQIFVRKKNQAALLVSWKFIWCFAIAWWEGSCNIRRWKRVNTWVQMTTTVNTSQKAKKSKVDWNTVCLNLIGRLCNVIICTTQNIVLQLYAVLWLGFILVVHCLDADGPLFQATVVTNTLIVRSRRMLIKLAHEQCFMT